MENKKDYIKQISKALINLINNDILSDKDAGLNDASIKHEYTIKNILNIVYDLNIINTNDIKSNYPGIDLVDETNKTVYQISSKKDKKKKIDDTIKEIDENDLIKKHSISHIVVFFLTKEKISFKNNTKETWKKWANTHKVDLEYYNLNDLKIKIINKIKNEHNENKIYKLLQYLQINKKDDFFTFEIPLYYNIINKKLQQFTTSNFKELQNQFENFMKSDNKILLIKAVQGHGKTHFINYLVENSNFNGYIPLLIINTSCSENILKNFNPELNWVIILDDIDRYNDSFINYLINGILLIHNIKIIFTCRQSYNFKIETYSYEVKYENLNIEWEENHIDELINQYKTIHPENKMALYEYDSIKKATNNSPYFILYLFDNSLININDCKNKNFHDISKLIKEKLNITDNNIINNILMSICLNIPFKVKENICINSQTVLNILVDNNIMYNSSTTYRFTYDIVGDLILAYIIESYIYNEYIFKKILINNSYNNIVNFTYALEYVHNKKIYIIEEILNKYIDYKEINNDTMHLYAPLIHYMPNLTYNIIKAIKLNDFSIYILNEYINKLIYHLQNQKYKLSFSEYEIVEIILNIYNIFKYNDELFGIIGTEINKEIDKSVFYHFIIDLFNIYAYNTLKNDMTALYDKFIGNLYMLHISKEDINIIEKNLIMSLYIRQHEINQELYQNNKKYYYSFFVFLHKNYVKRNNDKNGILDYLPIILDYTYLPIDEEYQYIITLLKNFKYTFKEQEIIEKMIINSLHKYDEAQICKINNLIKILNIFKRPPLYIFYCFIKNNLSAYFLEKKLKNYHNLDIHEKLIFVDKLFDYIDSYSKKIIPYNTDNLTEYFYYVKSLDGIIEFIIGLNDRYYFYLDEFIKQNEDITNKLYINYNKLQSDFIKKIVINTYYTNNNITISNLKVILCNDKNILYSLIITINSNNINKIFFNIILYKIIDLDITLFDILIKQLNCHINSINKKTAKKIIKIIIKFIKKTKYKNIAICTNLPNLIANLIQNNYNIYKLKNFIIKNIDKILQHYQYSDYTVNLFIEHLNFSLKEKERIYNNLFTKISNNTNSIKIENLFPISCLINNQESFNIFIKSFLKYRGKNRYIKIQTYNILHYILPYFNKFSITNSNIDYFDNFLKNINHNNTELYIDFLQIFMKNCSADTVGNVLDYLYGKIDNTVLINILSNNNDAITIYQPHDENMYLSSLEDNVKNKDLLELIKKLKNRLKQDINTINNMGYDRYTNF